MMAHAGSIRLSRDLGIHNSILSNHGRSNQHTVCHNSYVKYLHVTLFLVAKQRVIN